MSRMLFRQTLSIGFVAIAASMSACSSDPETEPSTTSTRSVPTSGASTTTLAPAKTGNAEIDALLEVSRSATYHVVYADADGQTLEIYRDGDQTALFNGSQAIYQLRGGESAACELAPTPTCMALPTGGGSVDAFLNTTFAGVASVFVAAADNPDPSATPAEMTDEHIAERQARCVNVTLETTAYSVCIDAEIGIFLKIATTQPDGSKTEFLARKVEVDNVDEAIFELPAPVAN